MGSTISQTKFKSQHWSRLLVPMMLINPHADWTQTVEMQEIIHPVASCMNYLLLLKTQCHECVHCCCCALSPWCLFGRLFVTVCKSSHSVHNCDCLSVCLSVVLTKSSLFTAVYVNIKIRTKIRRKQCSTYDFDIAYKCEHYRVTITA